MNIVDTINRFPHYMYDSIYSIDIWDNGDIVTRVKTNVTCNLPLYVMDIAKTVEMPTWKVHYSEFEYRMLYAILCVLRSTFGNVDQIADSDNNFVNYVIHAS